MTESKAFVLEAMRRHGKAIAMTVQTASATMTGTELNAEAEYIPEFLKAREKQNMLTRKAGMTDGFVCRSSAGRVVRLIQNYDSSVYTDEPELLPAQWGFVWSDDPAHAKPFIALATSPYQKGNCCTENGSTYRSLMDHNVYSPSAYPAGWEKL
jgi:hypothetical protein